MLIVVYVKLKKSLISKDIRRVFFVYIYEFFKNNNWIFVKCKVILMFVIDL